MGIDADIEAEIEQIHQVIERWFANKAAVDSSFDRLESALAPEFRLVNPSGIEIDRQTLLDRLRQARGERPGVRIWAEDVQLIRVAGDIVVARYVEWEREGEHASRRVSTVVFVRSKDHPNGLKWLRIHETRVKD